MELLLLSGYFLLFPKFVPRLATQIYSFSFLIFLIYLFNHITQYEISNNFSIFILIALFLFSIIVSRSLIYIIWSPTSINNNTGEKTDEELNLRKYIYKNLRMGSFFLLAMVSSTGAIFLAQFTSKYPLLFFTEMGFSSIFALWYLLSILYTILYANKVPSVFYAHLVSTDTKKDIQRVLLARKKYIYSPILISFSWGIVNAWVIKLWKPFLLSYLLLFSSLYLVNEIWQNYAVEENNENIYYENIPRWDSDILKRIVIIVLFVLIVTIFMLFLVVVNMYKH